MNEIETFYGLIEGTADALRVFELCRQGRLGRVRRRLHEKERGLIRSGSVFVFDEQESGIRRWTDGRIWSPSRILGNFLIYRELERKNSGTTSFSNFSPSDGQFFSNSPDEGMVAAAGGGSYQRYSDQATASGAAVMLPTFSWPNEMGANGNQGEDGTPSIEECAARRQASPEQPTGVNPAETTTLPAGTPQMQQLGFDCLTAQLFSSLHRQTSSNKGRSGEKCAASLLGPNAFRLLKSKKLLSAQDAATGQQTRFAFKQDGLIKKTISAKVDGRMQHLVCYFSESDFLVTHSHNPELFAILDEAEMAKGESIIASNFANAKGKRQGKGMASPALALMDELRKTKIPADLVLEQNFRRPSAAEFGYVNAGGVLVPASSLGPVTKAGRRRNSIHVSPMVDARGNLQMQPIRPAPTRRRLSSASTITTSTAGLLDRSAEELVSMDLSAIVASNSIPGFNGNIPGGVIYQTPEDILAEPIDTSSLGITVPLSASLYGVARSDENDVQLLDAALETQTKSTEMRGRRKYQKSPLSLLSPAVNNEDQGEETQGPRAGNVQTPRVDDEVIFKGMVSSTNDPTLPLLDLPAEAEELEETLRIITEQSRQTTLS